MKPAWDVFVNQLSDAVRKWDSLVPKLPDSLPLQNPPGMPIPKEGISKALSSCLARFEAVNADADTDPIMIVTHQPGIQGQVTALLQVISNASTNPATLNPQAVQILVSHLWSLHTILVWFPPTAQQVMESLGADRNLVDQGIRVLRAASTIISNEKESKAALQESINAQAQIQELLEKVIGHERESGTAKTNAQASASAVEANRQTIDENLKQMSEGVQQQTALLSAIETLKEQAESALRGASQTGLAHSFAKNRKRLEWIQFGWGITFVAGLVVLGFLEYGALGALNLNNYPRIIAHAVVGLPFVWLTWFAALQYGRSLRLAADYSFKEASALAFYGYRQEMVEDPEMVALLREAAIRNFGANPVRVLGKEDAASPLHHMLEMLLNKASKASPAEIAKIVASLTKREK
ncbi:MAG: hypothetical protein ACYCRH_08270 [Acidiferrobacteraceae bacterium]